ncbi:MAG TPA: PEP-CTERM sorting domain-containing protein [Pirellulales bacterium]|nr:PEP-CTERM sorting domain-containing protein [Pirellulales bacterium]
MIQKTLLCQMLVLNAAWIGMSSSTLADVQKIIFTIDPSQSSLSAIAVDNAFGTTVAQPGGSLSSPLSGHFLVEFDPTNPTSIQFDGGNGFMNLATTGSYLPGPDPANNSSSLTTPAPADLGGRSTDDQVQYAYRGLSWDWQSPTLPINSGDNSFDVNQLGYQVLGGVADIIYPGLGGGTVQFTGDSGNVSAVGTASFSQASPGNWTFSFSFHVPEDYSFGSAGSGVIDYAGHLVATAQFGAGNTAPVSAGSNTPPASLIGGAAQTGGLDASFANVTTSGNVYAQQIPTTGLSVQAYNSLATETNFHLIGGATPQIWEVSFSGAFSGPATLTFNYDPTQLGGADPSSLFIEHFNSNTQQWENLGGIVDATNHTITIQTSSFSGFALATVPEPSTLALLAMGAVFLAGLVRRRRRK